MNVTCDEILLVCKKIEQFKKRQKMIKKIASILEMPFDSTKLNDAEFDAELIDFYWLSLPRSDYANSALRTIYNRYIHKI